MTCAFDRKFGDDFVTNLPHDPGVYRFYDRHGELVYVGKAKDLRRRLSQYRKPKRIKAHRKMKRIVAASARLEFQVTATEKDALLLENELIREHRPPLNVVGAFSFLYPSIGLQRSEHYLHVAYSTQGELLEERGFRLFGCYRNRSVARAGFDALTGILEWLGHRERAPERLPYTSWLRFRQVSASLDSKLADFLLGDSDAFLETVFMHLLEKPAARRNAADVQACIASLEAFFGTECVKLQSLRALSKVDYITQDARDAATIHADYHADAEVDAR